MKAVLSYCFPKSLPSSSSKEEKKHIAVSSVSAEIPLPVQVTQTEASQVLKNDSESEFKNKRRFPPPSDVNFLPTNEIMRRFNAQVEAGIIKPIKDADTKEIKIITFFETAPKIIYPLNIAIIENNKAMVKELLSKGAFLDVLDQTGKTPLANAFNLGNSSIMDVLIAAKNAEFQISPQSPYAPSCSNSECGDDSNYSPNSTLKTHNNQQDPVEQPTLASKNHQHHHYHLHHHHHHHDGLKNNCGIQEEGNCKEETTSSLPIISTVFLASPSLSSSIMMITPSSSVAATAIPLLLKPKKKSYANRLKKATRRMIAYVKGVLPE